MSFPQDLLSNKIAADVRQDLLHPKPPPKTQQSIRMDVRTLFMLTLQSDIEEGSATKRNKTNIEALKGKSQGRAAVYDIMI